jgi:F-type H+-transporting ATPase subunit delta
MSYDAIARRWARAIFEIGKEGGPAAVTRIEADVSSFAQTYAENRELSAVLDNPLVPEPEREALLVEIAERMGLSETARSTLRLLSRKRRIAALPSIARQLSRLVDEDQNVLRAEVSSAGPLSEDYLAKLRAALEQGTGKKVVVTFRQDPSLIAGVVTKIGDRVIDGSVRARLAGFRESLLR